MLQEAEPSSPVPSPEVEKEGPATSADHLPVSRPVGWETLPCHGQQPNASGFQSGQSNSGGPNSGGPPGVAQSFLGNLGIFGLSRVAAGTNRAQVRNRQSLVSFRW